MAASSLEDGVLCADVYASEDGTDTVEMYFTVIDDDTCEVGRSNTSSGSSFAIDADYDGEVVIPRTVSYGADTYTVVGIQDAAFGSTSVGNACALAGVTVPSTVQTIGSHAFRNCTALAALVFDGDDDNPSELADIGTGAFLSCTSLTSVVFPPSLVSIGASSFRYCTSLASVEFDDIENSQLTYLGGTSSGTTQTGGNAFGCSEDEPGCLASIVLPAGVLSIPAGTFAYQEQLVSFEFLGEEMNFIGASAFYDCSSLYEIVIPDLAGYDGSWQFCLWEKAFTGCDSLTYIAFLGDGSTEGYKNYSQVFGETPSLVAVAYWDVEYEGNSQDQGQNSDEVTTRLFGDEVDYYFNVSFYETEEDAEADEDEISSIRLREDVTVGELREVLAGEAQLDEDAVFTACGDTGCLPTEVEGFESLSEAYWAFEGGFVDTTSFSACAYAWCDTVADDGTIDIAACRISLSQTDYTIASTTIDMTNAFTIAAPDGSAVPDTAYTIYAIGTFVEGEGGGQTTTTVTYDDVSALSEDGDYALYFEAVDGEGFAGTTWVGFTISQSVVEVIAYPGESKYAYTMVQDLYEQNAYTSAVVVAESDMYGAAAAQWMASVMGSAVFVLPDGEVPDRATSNYLLAALSYSLKSGATIYALGDTDLISEEAYSALGEASSSFSTQRLSFSGSDAPAQVWRSFSESYGGSDTAYVVSQATPAYAAAATLLAFEEGAPVFFCDEDGGVGAYTRMVLKTGRFQTIVLVGEEGIGIATMQEQVGNVTIGFSQATDSAQDASLSCAGDYYADHADDTGLTAIFAPADDDGTAYAVMAAVVAAQTGSALFLFESEASLEAAIPESFLDEETAARTSLVLFLGEADFFDEAQDYLADLWAAGDDDE